MENNQNHFDELSRNLEQAVRANRLDSVISLLEAGVDPNTQGFYETRMLHIASQMGLTEIAKHLIAAGADVNPRNGELKTPLHLAAMYCRPEVVELLLNEGADPNPFDASHCFTPLHWAVNRSWGYKQRDLKNVHLLVEAGGSVNAVDAYGVGVLRYAFFNNDIDLIRFLMENGANPFIVDEEGEAVVDLVRKGRLPPEIQAYMKLACEAFEEAHPDMAMNPNRHALHPPHRSATRGQTLILASATGPHSAGQKQNQEDQESESQGLR